MAAVVLLAGLVATDAARLMVARVEAQTAADAAALAAAPVTFAPFGARGDARSEAERFAAANGARLVDCACPPDPVWRARVVTVTVAVDGGGLFGVGEIQARASARFDPTSWLDLA
jgi:hypothetical protein